MTFEAVFSHSIPAVTNTIDAAQVAEPLKVQLSCVFLYSPRCLLSNQKPFESSSNVTTQQHNQVCTCCTLRIEPAHQRGSMQPRHVTVSSSPCDQRQRCPVVLWNPPRERRGGRIQLLFGPECVQGAALSVSTANHCSAGNQAKLNQDS